MRSSKLVTDNSGNIFSIYQMEYNNFTLKNNFTNPVRPNATQSIIQYYLVKLGSDGKLLFSDSFTSPIKIAVDGNGD